MTHTTFLDPNTVDLCNLPPLLPYMPPEEYRWLEDYMAAFDVLVEVGGGLGSFYWDEHLECTVLYVIEHDPAWYRLISAIQVLRGSVYSSCKFLHLLGKADGLPDPALLERLQYIKNGTLDLAVFLDGPNRVAWGRWLAEHVQCPVLIHDWNRSEYKELLDVYTVKDEYLDGQGCAFLAPIPPFQPSSVRPSSPSCLSRNLPHDPSWPRHGNNSQLRAARSTTVQYLPRISPETPLVLSAQDACSSRASRNL
jgi:hypothetical protein